jgi:hypothetical protein
VAEQIKDFFLVSNLLISDKECTQPKYKLYRKKKKKTASQKTVAKRKEKKIGNYQKKHIIQNKIEK